MIPPIYDFLANGLVVSVYCLAQMSHIMSLGPAELCLPPPNETAALRIPKNSKNPSTACMPIYLLTWCTLTKEIEACFSIWLVCRTNYEKIFQLYIQTSAYKSVTFVMVGLWCFKKEYPKWVELFRQVLLQILEIKKTVWGSRSDNGVARLDTSGS